MSRSMLGLLMAFLATQAPAETVGLRLSQIQMPHQAAPVEYSIWYPATGGPQSTFGENGVFEGVPVAMDAAPLPGERPLVLLSHGMGGSFRAQAWLARGLAERGALVAAVNHPHTTWGDFDMSKGIRHWTRASDLSRALDHTLIDPAFADQIDTNRIMAAGFSYGGWTALSLGGITGNHAAFVAAYETHSDEMDASDVLLAHRVDLAGLDAEDWNRSRKDSRVTHVAAIDPGLVWGLGAANVADLVPDTLLIGFGDTENRMLDTNFDASGLAGHLHDAQIIRFAPAFHFTAMPVCKPAGAAILKEEGDDPVCTDPPGTDRAGIHGEIIDLIAARLDL